MPRGAESRLTAKYEHTVHARVLQRENGRSELAFHGCESCHGPGGAHVEAGGGKGVGGLVPFARTRPKPCSAHQRACLACHKGGERAYWHGSAHEAADVACTSCHTLMENVSHDHLLAKRTEVETCAACHPMQYSRIYSNAHMPLRPGAFEVSTASEGKMRCSSCHQPHGTVTESLIPSISVNDQCLSCHAEKRGPFLWEHSPVPERLPELPRAARQHAAGDAQDERAPAVPDLSRLDGTCDEPAPIRTIASRSATSCLQCHTQVHGSNHPSGFALTR